MGWTAPRTWVTGEVVSKTIMDTHLRDNLNYLLASRPTTTKHAAFTAYAAANTSFADVDAAAAFITHVTESGRVLIIVSVSVLSATNSAGPNWGALDLIADSPSARMGDTTYGLITVPNASAVAAASFVGIATGLTIGSRTFKLQARSQGSANVNVGAGGTGQAIFHAVAMDI